MNADAKTRATIDARVQWILDAVLWLAATWFVVGGALVVIKARHHLNLRALGLATTCAASAVVLIAIMRFRRVWRAKMSLIVLALGPTLLMVETGLWVWVRRNAERPALAAAAAARAAGRRPDRRSLFQVMLDLRAAGDSAVTLFRPPVTVRGRPLLPLGGIANRSTVLCDEDGRHLVYRSDELGFRNPPGLWTHAVDVALVGDSHAQGYCVVPDSDLAGWLRRSRPATVTLGIGGNGPLAELAALREYLDARRPRFVVWMYSDDDLSDLPGEMLTPALTAYERDGFRQGLEGVQADLDSAVSRAFEQQVSQERDGAWTRWRRLAGKILRLYYLRTALGLGVSSVPACCDIERFARILAAAKRSVDAWGGQLVFVLVPSKTAFGTPPATRPTIAARPGVRRAVEALGVPFVDGDSLLRTKFADPRIAYSNPLDDLRAEGYQVLADEVATLLNHLSRPVRRAPGK